MANILEKKQMIICFTCPTITGLGKSPEIGEQEDVESYLSQKAFCASGSLISPFFWTLQTAPRNEALICFPFMVLPLYRLH